MASLEELEKRVAALEAHVSKLPAGMVRFVCATEQVRELTPYEQVTAGLSREQLNALENAGLTSVAKLKKAAKDEDGFTKIDGIGPAADAKLREALKENSNA